MATALSLVQAAGQAADNLYPFWLAGTLKTKLTTFGGVCLAQFPESEENSHPASNWGILIANLADLMPGASVPFSSLQLATQYVYRVCLMTNTLRTATPTPLISAAQATAILASYNLQF